jgi:hypothetical protein
MHLFRTRCLSRSLLSALLCVTLALPHALAQGAADTKAKPAETKGDAKKADEKKADQKKAEAKKGDAKKADEKKSDAEAPHPATLPLAESLTGDAKEAYESGKVLYGDGDFAGAKLKFERAHELSKDPRLLWNMAATEKQQRRYDRVLSLVERYLAEGGEALTDEDRQEAKGLLDMIRALVTEVTVKVSEPGAEVSVDGEKLGESPLDKPLILTQGERAFAVTKPGFKPYRKSQNLQGGTKTTLDVALEADIREGRLRVVAGIDDVIRIDGRVVGKGQWEGKLASGTHSLSVSGKGKRAQQSDVVIEDGQLRTERIALEPIVVAGPPEKDKDSGAAWMFAGGGAALAIGLGIAAYFLFRPEGETRQERASGTIPPSYVPLRF